MSKKLLDVKDLTVYTESNLILDSLNIQIGQGETHVLMGPNGAGKSTLGYTLMGHPNYQVQSGTIVFDGEDITQVKTDTRAKKGIFLSFQNPIEVPGISLYNFIRSARNTRPGRKQSLTAYRRGVEETMELLEMKEDYAARELNLGFSGGEKKKSEILQMLLLKPRLAILDETDSGLDVDAVRTVSKGIQEFQKEKDTSLLIITHNTKILEYLKVDWVHILVQGRMVKSGDSSLISQINLYGFEPFYHPVLTAAKAAEED